MNSILQCLSSTSILTECLLSGDAQKTKKARNNGIVEGIRVCMLLLVVLSDSVLYCSLY